MAVGGDGTTAVVWRQASGGGGSVWLSIRSPRGTFSAPVSLSTPDKSASDQQISVARDGTTTVVWRAYSRGAGDGIGTVQASTMRPGGGFSPPVDLSIGGDPQVAVSADGTTTVVWSRAGDTTTTGVIQASTRQPRGTFAAPVNVSPPDQDAGGPGLAVGADGTTTVVWSRRVWSPFEDLVVRESTRQPGGSFSTPVVLSEPTTDRVPPEPRVGVAANGETTVLWSRVNRTSYVTEASTRRPGGTFGAPVELYRPGRRALPRLAVGADGTAGLVYVPVDLFERPHASAFRVAVAPDGAATIVWLERDTLNHGVVHERSPPIPPGAAPRPENQRQRAPGWHLALPARQVHGRRHAHHQLDAGRQARRRRAHHDLHNRPEGRRQADRLPHHGHRPGGQDHQHIRRHPRTPLTRPAGAVGSDEYERTADEDPAAIQQARLPDRLGVLPDQRAAVLRADEEHREHRADEREGRAAEEGRAGSPR